MRFDNMFGFLTFGTFLVASLVQSSRIKMMFFTEHPNHDTSHPRFFKDGRILRVP